MSTRHMTWLIVFTVSIVATAHPAVAQKVYWANPGNGLIQRANLDGSAVEDIIASERPVGIALDPLAGKIYWSDIDADSIRRADLDGSGIEDLVTTGLLSPRGLALDLSASKMYWVDSGTEKIQRANLDGSSVEDLIATNSAFARYIALDAFAGKIYWTVHRVISEGKIMRADLDGSNITIVTEAGLIQPRGIALDLDDLKMYWVHRFFLKIQRSNLDGSNHEDIIGLVGGSEPNGIAVDSISGKLYWSQGGSSIQPGSILRVDRSGSNIETLVSREGRSFFPAGIALDLTCSVTGPDCQSNGIPDECDLVRGISEDCNINDIPDECEPDADSDGVIDDCDGCPLDPRQTSPGPCASDGLPTVSIWGMVVLALLLLIGLNLLFRRAFAVS